MITKICLILICYLTTFPLTSIAQKFNIEEEFIKFNSSNNQHFKDIETTLSGSNELIDIEKLELAKTHLAHGDYFQFKEEKDLPLGLIWQSGTPQPIVGDARAKKGGTVNLFHTYPPNTLRSFGPNANSSMRSVLYDNIDLGLLSQHPVTNEYMPCLARSWALAKDKKTVYYRLNKSARYSDGVSVEAIDYLVAILLKSHNYSKSPFSKMYYTNMFLGYTLYDETLAIHLAKRHVDPILFTNSSPLPKHFYQDFDRDFVTKYDNRFPPTTGAYLYSGELSSTQKTVQTKVKNWWAKDLAPYKYAYNADKIIYHHTGKGIVNAIENSIIDIAEIPANNRTIRNSEAVKNDQLKITTFRFESPAIPRGFYLNTASPKLKDVRVRQALQHSFNIQAAITNAEGFSKSKRLNQFSEGFGKYSNPNIVARAYSKKESAKLFTEAGYHKDKDGFWTDKEGVKLSFTLIYSDSNKNIYQEFMSILQRQARVCGVEINLENLDQMVLFKRMIEKQSEIVFSGWGVIGPFPRFHQFFHSSNAYNPDGSVRINTNNLNSYSNPEMDNLIAKYRASYLPKEHLKLAHEIQQHIHDSAIFIPAFKYDSKDIAYRNWIQWPNSETTKFSPVSAQYPIEHYLWWVDSDIKNAALKAESQK